MNGLKGGGGGESHFRVVGIFHFGVEKDDESFQLNPENQSQNPQRIANITPKNVDVI